jgi:CheY-like chemotaxis protein
MRNTEQPQTLPQQGEALKSLLLGRRKKRQKPIINLALDKSKAAKTMGRIGDRVDFHHRCALEIRAKIEELTSAAISELLKVKELKSVVESLKNDGDELESARGGWMDPEGQPLPSHPAGQTEKWNRELEKLLIAKSLLEASLPERAEENPCGVVPTTRGLKRILLIDDDPTTVKIISHFLQKENYAVSSTNSGVDGLKKAFKENPDLILLDIMMPDLNGFQFLSIYRKDEENARVPVIILSSLAEEADVLKGLEIGAVDYITKPFSPQVLLAKIKKSTNSGP